ncbi:MAG: ActS/PrrB/RegB family redox-sensitive histidine kinase [Bosea sp. (in: a-proteobacteria)]
MADHLDIALARASRRLRLDTLVRLRWLAVLGQGLAIAFVALWLGFEVPLAPCIGLLTASVWLNIALRVRYPMSHRLSDRAATGLLAYDVLQLGALLYVTGGLENPFALLFVAPVLISATAQPPVHTLALGGLVVGSASFLAFFHLPLPWDKARPLDLPSLYVGGIWVSILLGVAFTAIYAWRVSAEADDLAEALTAAEMVMAREQHLSQLDGLAAAAAHELGTPLATITLVAKEIANAAQPGSALAEDIALLRQEVDRCRKILSTLTSLDEDSGPLSTFVLSQLLEEIAGPQRPFGVPILVAATGAGDEPVMRRNPSVLYGIGNLVDNAVDFATSSVTLSGSWTATRVEIVVKDDGPGFAPDILLRAGEPYITSRGRNRERDRASGSVRQDKIARQGLGLGLFIAKTLLERSGAQVVFANNSRDQGGARITVSWPRKAFEARTSVAGLEHWKPVPNLRSSETI